jgi:hypothetical protein
MSKHAATSYTFRCSEVRADGVTLTRESDGRLAVRVDEDPGYALVYLTPGDAARMARSITGMGYASGTLETAPDDVKAECPPGGCAIDGLGRSECPPGSLCADDEPQRETLDDALAEAASTDPGAVPTFLDAMMPQPGTINRERAFIRARELLSQGNMPYSSAAVIELARYLADEAE